MELQWEEEGNKGESGKELDPSTQIMLRLQSVEIERIRFMLRAYLRCRIKKVLYTTSSRTRGLTEPPCLALPRLRSARCII